MELSAIYLFIFFKKVLKNNFAKEFYSSNIKGTAMKEYYRTDNSSRGNKSRILRIHFIVLAKEGARLEQLSGN